MITEKEAVRIAKKNIPSGKIQKMAAYRDKFLFMIFTSDPLEGQMDPYYSVNRNSGDFRPFAYLKDMKTFHEVMRLFEKAPRYKE